MIKALVTGDDGRQLLLLGLSFANLDQLRAAPADSMIKVGAETGLPIDVIVFSGETEATIVESMKGIIGPETQMHVELRST